MDEKRAKKLLYEVIDNEASEIEASELKSFLKENAEFKAVFDLETRLRSELRQRAKDELCPDELKQAVLAALDAVDAEELSGETASSELISIRASSKPVDQTRPQFSFRYSLAMAASFMLFLFGAFATTQFFQHQRAFGAFENSHFASRNQLSAGVGAEFADDATSYIIEKFGVDILSEMPGLSLCGGELVDLEQSRFAHLQFCGSDEDPISIFVGSAADYSLPEMPSTIIAGKEYFRHSCHGCELMYWRSGGALIVAATSPDHMDDYPLSDLVINPTEAQNGSDNKSASGSNDPSDDRSRNTPEN